MSEFYGIDLGTTYSCIAKCDEKDGIITVIPNLKGEMVTPSVVYIDDKGKIYVGKAAKSKLLSDPDNAVAFIKREMSNKDYTRKLQGKEYTPQQISSMILKHLVDFANQKRKDEDGKEPIYDVVITVPAYFGRLECERTAEAGKLAGLNVLRLIHEPTAAAMYYGQKQNGNKKILVYDLGGGTFDVTIMEFKNNIANTLSSTGNHKLGGADWDRKIVDIALEHEKLKWDNLSPKDKSMLMNAAEVAKQNLTDDEETTLQFSANGIHTVDITREDFEARTADLMMQTQMLVESALDMAELQSSDIDELLLVGGSTFMPMVMKMVKQIFPNCEIKFIDPNMAVAKGAALMATYDDNTGSIAGGGLTLGVDKGTRAYGVKIMGEGNKEVVNNLILVNDDLIIERTETFSTYRNGQTDVALFFYESTSEENYMDVDPELEIKAKGGNNLVSWGKPVPAGTPVEVKVTRDKSGLVTFTVSCMGATGKFEID